jgi:hypothetical protein
MTLRDAHTATLTAGLLAGLALCLTGAPAGAQDAVTFAPTYAASQGSPYSEVYARTFGHTGKPAQAAPLETAAPPAVPAAVPAPAPGPGGVVYVIEDNRLLTYRADDYTGFSGGGAAVDQAPLPPAETAYIGGAPEVRVPTVADRFYGATVPAGPAFEAAPLDTAGGPIPLIPAAGLPAE